MPFENTMKEIQLLEKRISAIEERNKKVGLDKSWEGSTTRKILLFFFTYIAVSVYLWTIGIEHAFLNAVVPSVAFLLSTLTLPFFKKVWQKTKKKDTLHKYN
jgi:hypothetical protein